jgi:hypothetical protein
MGPTFLTCEFQIQVVAIPTLLFTTDFIFLFPCQTSYVPLILNFPELSKRKYRRERSCQKKQSKKLAPK